MKQPLVVLAGAAVIAGLSCFGVAWRSTVVGHATARPVATVPTTATVSTSTTVAAPVETGAATPVRVEVAAVGLSAAVVPVGLTSGGDMAVPPPTVVGWYQLGPAPGAVGPAVLVGHVDSRSGPAVFYRLTALHVGDTVVVDRADGSRARFSISAVTVVDKAAFPLAAVFAPTRGPALRLITCTGPFDPYRHHYTESLIAWGVAVS
jgi:hypothetical protein